MKLYLSKKSWIMSSITESSSSTSSLLREFSLNRPPFR
ncbi:MAG: KxYKxGKxW signal peptide domain-containing protein [Candidatus Nanohaloarchaea archaeon]